LWIKRDAGRRKKIISNSNLQQILAVLQNKKKAKLGQFQLIKLAELVKEEEFDKMKEDLS